MAATQLHDELVTMLSGGAETTSSTAAWALHEITRHPAVERELRAEIDSVLGRLPIQFEDIPKLTYLEQVLNETVRLHAAPLLIRRSIKPIVLCGVAVDAGTEVACSPYAMHRDGRYFDQPERFRPERWSDLKLPHRTLFIPFGAGPRKCIGDSLAWTQLAITIVTIFQHWALRPDPAYRVRELPAAITRPDALPMTVEEVGTLRRPPRPNK